MPFLATDARPCAVPPVNVSGLLAWPAGRAWQLPPDLPVSWTLPRGRENYRCLVHELDRQPPLALLELRGATVLPRKPRPCPPVGPGPTMLAVPGLPACLAKRSTIDPWSISEALSLAHIGGGW